MVNIEILGYLLESIFFTKLDTFRHQSHRVIFQIERARATKIFCYILYKFEFYKRKNFVSRARAINLNIAHLIWT